MRRALLLATLLVASLLNVAAPAQAAAPVCQIPFATAGYPPGWSQIKDKPDTWAQTDGNVITAEILYVPGGPLIAIGGNFTKVGTTPARNLAVLRVSDGSVVWAAQSMTGYPRAMKAINGVLYVGGGFTAINGVPRKAIAAFNAFTFALLPWQPAVNGGTIRSIQVSNSGIAYLAGNGGVGAYRTSNAQQVWYVPTRGGVVRVVLLTPEQNMLYVGGLFTHLGGVNQQYLSAIYPLASGTVFSQFAPNMRPRPAGDHSGELVLKLAWDTSTSLRKLIVAAGGSQTNSLQLIEPSYGGKWWSHNVEGDTQAVVQLGNTILAGHHRSHGNTTTGCPLRYFGNQWSNSGFVLPWDPGLNNGTAGRATAQSVQSEGNGGIGEIVVEPQTRKVFVVGDFTAYGGNCDYAATTMFYVPCTGSTPLRGLARYGY